MKLLRAALKKPHHSHTDFPPPSETAVCVQPVSIRNTCHTARRLPANPRRGGYPRPDHRPSACPPPLSHTSSRPDVGDRALPLRRAAGRAAAPSADVPLAHAELHAGDMLVEEDRGRLPPGTPGPVPSCPPCPAGPATPHAGPQSSTPGPHTLLSELGVSFKTRLREREGGREGGRERGREGGREGARRHGNSKLRAPASCRVTAPLESGMLRQAPVAAAAARRGSARNCPSPAVSWQGGPPLPRSLFLPPSLSHRISDCRSESTSAGDGARTHACARATDDA